MLWTSGCAVAPGDGSSAGGAPGQSERRSAPGPTDLPTADIPTAAEAAASSAASQVAAAPAAAPVPVDPLRPDVHLDLDDRTAREDLWVRVRQGFAMPDLTGDLVHEREQWYLDRPEYVQRMTQRGSRYLFYIVEELEHRGMPTELALLPFIESAFNPQAISTAKASGMWQFMSATGRDFDLKQNIFRDDRRDILASTRAALDYLQRLHTMFGDWHLALAAYNWGEGNVGRAIARNQKLGLPTDYASLTMPSETANYVPKLQAMKNLVARPADFALTLPVVMNHPYFLAVPIDRDMDVAVAVRLADMSMDEFRTLNPQMNKPVILAAGTPQVLLPYDNANNFVRQLPLHRGPLASWTAWTAPRTARTADVAREVGMSESELREVNRIPPRMLVKAGSTLLVPRSEHRIADVSVDVADNATMALAPDLPPLKKTSIRAGRRDSVATIAQRYRLSPAQVADWNHVATTSSFRPGQAVVVFLSPRASTRSTVRETSGPPSSRAVVQLISVPKAAPAPRTAATPSSPHAARTAANRTLAAVPPKPVLHPVRASSSAKPAVRLAKTETGAGAGPAAHSR